MKLNIITSLFVLLLIGTIAPVVNGAVSIFDLQYTAAADGKSPYHQQFVDCLGGVVIAKVSKGIPRLIIHDTIIRDPNIQDAACCWGAIQLKDWSGEKISDHVNIGDWIELNNVPVEDNRGTTFIQYGMGGTASSFSIVSRNNPVPEPLLVDVNDIASPVEDPCDPGAYYVEDHAAEKYESMWIKIRDVSVVEKDMGKASDNYILQSAQEPNDPNFSCWAADYMNTDAVDEYHPFVQVDQHFCSVEGFFEQYTNLSDGFDYYQLITTQTEDLLKTQPGDFDDDCDVDLGDYSHFSQYWLAECYDDPNLCGQADMEIDSVVNVNDLKEFVYHWLDGVN